MKNKLTILIVSTILLVFGLGCGITDRVQKAVGGSENTSTTTPKDKTLTDKTVDVTVGDEKIGIPECDALFDSIAEQSKATEDNYVAKATRQYFLNKIKESIKKSIEENKNDPVQTAKECKEYKAQLDKFKAEEDSNKQK